MGCILPLCDCAMVPITEKFIQKGLKVSHAMTFSVYHQVLILLLYWQQFMLFLKIIR